MEPGSDENIINKERSISIYRIKRYCIIIRTDKYLFKKNTHTIRTTERSPTILTIMKMFGDKAKYALEESTLCLQNTTKISEMTKLLKDIIMTFHIFYI